MTEGERTAWKYAARQEAENESYMRELQAMTTERDALRRAFDDILPWAARYAHGRSTYAPGDVRRAVETRKCHDPEWDVRQVGRVGLEPIENPMLQQDDLTDVFPPED